MLKSTWRFVVATTALLASYAAAPVRAQVGTWQLLPNMGTRREGVGAATGPDGRIYAVGGYNSYGFWPTYVEAYDPRTGVWSGAATIITPRRDFGCVRGPDGRIYAIGGSGGVTAEAIDTRTGLSSPIAPLPIDISTEGVTSAAVGNDGRIYVLACGPVFRRMLSYNLSNNTWTVGYIDSTGPSILANDQAGRIYMAGSSESSVNGIPILVFDPLANTFRSIRPFPLATASLTALTPGGDGRMYAVGLGYAYDAALDSWVTVPSPPNSNGPAAATGLDGNIYAIGGWGETSDGTFYSTDSAAVYQVSGPSVTAAGTINAIERVAFTGVVATFTDPRSTNPSDFTASINWGDGQTSSGIVSARTGGGFSVTGTHTYTAGGTFATKVTVTAKSGGTGFTPGTAVVTPQLSATGLDITSSKSYSGPVANFRDLNPSSTTAYKASIQWGDGTSSNGTVQARAGGGFNVTGKHTYNLRRSSYGITVTITKSGVSPATATSYFHWTGK